MEEGREKPVLFVPGYADAVSDGESLYPWWQTLVDNLEENGFDGEVDWVDLGPKGFTVASPRRYAVDIEQKLGELYERHDQPVNVIAHSMGGLSTRWAIEQGDAERYVDTLVTLGTPHQGTPYAWLGIWTPGGRDMVPGSRFLNTLNDDGVSSCVDYVAVYSTADEGYPGPEYAAIPEAENRGNVENIRLSGHRHMDLLSSEDVLDAYYDVLR